MCLIYFSYELNSLHGFIARIHSFLVVPDHGAVDALPRVSRRERIRVSAFPQVVLVLVHDERPPDDGQLPLKQRDLGGGKMERAEMLFCGRYVAEIPRVRVCTGARPVNRIRGVEMPAAAGAVAAQQVAELVHVKPVLARRQVFNVTRNLHRGKRVLLPERHVTSF